MSNVVEQLRSLFDSLGDNEVVSLVSCGKAKRSYKCPAYLLYTGNYFRAQYAFGKSVGSEVYIMSAKHGLLRETDWVGPYSVKLNEYTSEQRKRWVHMVCDDFCSLYPESEGVSVLVLGGKDYAAVGDELLRRGYHVINLWKNSYNMKIANQTAWYRTAIPLVLKWGQYGQGKYGTTE